MWNFNQQQQSSVQPSALTPTSSSASPPHQRAYENSTPENQIPQNYGYPPTPPKEVKAEENYFSGNSGISGDNYSPIYDAYKKQAKCKNPNAGKFAEKETKSKFYILFLLQRVVNA